MGRRALVRDDHALIPRGVGISLRIESGNGRQSRGGDGGAADDRCGVNLRRVAQYAVQDGHALCLGRGEKAVIQRRRIDCSAGVVRVLHVVGMPVIGVNPVGRRKRVHSYVQHRRDGRHPHNIFRRIDRPVQGAVGQRGIVAQIAARGIEFGDQELGAGLVQRRHIRGHIAGGIGVQIRVLIGHPLGEIGACGFRSIKVVRDRVPVLRAVTGYRRVPRRLFTSWV